MTRPAPITAPSASGQWSRSLFTRRIDTDTLIAAPADQVWDCLTDVSAYAVWNPFIRSLTGQIRCGDPLVVEIASPGGGTMRFRAKVLAAIPPRELRWIGRVLLPGLFDGEHSFLLRPLPDGRTRLIHRETFSGLLVPLLLGPAARARIQAGFQAMNEALGRRLDLHRADG